MQDENTTKSFLASFGTNKEQSILFKSWTYVDFPLPLVPIIAFKPGSIIPLHREGEEIG